MRFNKFGASEVDYGVHFHQFAAPFLVEGNAVNNSYFKVQAQEMHVLGVSQAVNEMASDTLALISAPTLLPDASKLLRYGVMRRWRMVSASFDDFRSTVTPDRKKPLTLEQTTLVGRSLNALYIDLLGLLDNYAWSLVYQAGLPETRNAKPMAIGLFSKTFRRDLGLAGIADRLASFESWQEEFKARRNPAAHRIPLHVPSAALTESEVIEHNRLEALASEALMRGEFESAAGHRNAAWGVGTFLHKFVHDPEEPLMDIWPTIPDDIGRVVSIGRLVHEFLHNAPANSMD